LPARFQLKRYLAAHRLLPRTRLAWFAVYFSVLEGFLLLLKFFLKAIHAFNAATSLSGWTGFLGFLLFLLLAFLGIRWFRVYLMWRLRNRLIVTYLFIGGVPVVLVLAMALISGYFFLGQFASFLAVSEIRNPLQELQAANAAVARQISRKAAPITAAQQMEQPENSLFPGRTVMLLPESEKPKWLANGFSGLVEDGGKIYLRAADLVDAGPSQGMVISSVPLDQKFLVRIAEKLGTITLYLPGAESTGLNVQLSGNKGFVVNGRSDRISAGSLPAAQNLLDKSFSYFAVLQPTDWKTGKSSSAVLDGNARISTLYSQLFLSVSEWAQILSFALVALAATFGIIVLIALLIGLRLTRTITLSVANLYDATQHINRGDFKHRIKVKDEDQLATLQVSFNSMTESLEKLIIEQKEKERLQSELAIAQEVQAQLFPAAHSSTGTLELYGVCRPARIVSGDYYDFLSYGHEQIGIAVGDISGKGISAALLMATIHSAVRAYEQEQLTTLSARRAAHQSAGSGSVALAVRNTPPQSASNVLWLLNRQLYKSTPPEKYATLFLGFYDGHARRLTYSNAGHLPPLILGANGDIRRMETGGTVVGLFDNMEYEEATVEMNPGDIFVAFSDGITEPENEFGEFGEDRLMETIAACRDLPLERISDQVIAAVQDWIGSTEQPDDITLVLARPRVSQKL
jgi:sigma-B regulation protein RsbU (phosphoserine phosphatase)